jgi:hypothetical protein
MASAGCKRFAEVEITDDLKRLRYAEGTNYQTEYSKKVFTSFLSLKGYILDVKASGFNASLDTYISEFLISVRKEDGNHYSAGGFDALFYGLGRHLQDEYAVDIVHDPIFIKLKTARKTAKGIIKKAGHGHVKHTDIVNDSDLKLISDMDTATPQKLQLKTWFLLQFHLALRGRENSHLLTKDDLIQSTENGRPYIEMRDMQTKNHRGETKDKSNGAKMFATSDETCPVKCVLLYLSKLHPENKSLWQRPKTKFLPSSPVWYDNMKVGVNKIGTFMKTLSEVASLSKIYTNHSPRATCITILGESFQDTDVATHSGHRSLSGMSSYKRTSEAKKMDMSQTLSSSLKASNLQSMSSLASTSHDPVASSLASTSLDALPSVSSLASTSQDPVPSWLASTSHDQVQYAPNHQSHNQCCLSYGLQDTDSVSSILDDLLMMSGDNFDVPNIPPSQVTVANNQSGRLMSNVENPQRPSNPPFINCTFGSGCVFNFN